jgi:hypothetical protein
MGQDFKLKNGIIINSQNLLKFNIPSSNNYVAFKGPSNGSNTITWTLPNTDGSANQVLGTSGSANLIWVTPTYSDNTQTLSNKRIQSRVQTVTSSTTWSANGDSYDVSEMIMTGAAGTLTISNPTGTPLNAQKLIYRIQSTYAQTLNWGAIFQGSIDLALPTTTSGNSKWDIYGFIYNSNNSKWQLAAKTAGF